MFNGKKKAITFSYDDGVTQDIRLIDLFNKYGLKGTFNLNSELLGNQNELIREGVRIAHNKIDPKDVRAIYAGHEVAAHTLTHPSLPTLPDEEVIRQAFNVSPKDNTAFLPGIMSRKKQVIPMLSALWG